MHLQYHHKTWQLLHNEMHVKLLSRLKKNTQLLTNWHQIRDKDFIHTSKGKNKIMFRRILNEAYQMQVKRGITYILKDTKILWKLFPFLKTLPDIERKTSLWSLFQLPHCVLEMHNKHSAKGSLSLYSFITRSASIRKVQQDRSLLLQSIKCSYCICRVLTGLLFNTNGSAVLRQCWDFLAANLPSPTDSNFSKLICSKP